MSKLSGRFLHVPLELAQQPVDGECLCNRRWSVHPKKGVSFYYTPFGYYKSEEPAPQCNAQEFTAKHLAKRLTPDNEVIQLPVVYLTHALRAMRKDREQLQKERANAFA